MLQLTPEQVESITRRLDFLRIEVMDIPQFSTMTQADYISDRNRRRNLERLVENVLNSSLDLAKIILAAGDLSIPDTYKEAMIQMGAAGFLSEDLAQQLAEMTRLRNILAHQYLDIRWASLQNFIRESPKVLDQFLKKIEQLISQATTNR